MSAKATLALIVFGCLLVAGTLGYSTIEGWPLFDSLYMTIITLSTVGFGELRPLSPAGKLFTSVLILSGVGTLAYAAAAITEEVLDRRLRHHNRRRRMEIESLRGHVIVCGFGRMGETVCEQLAARGVRLVVVEKDAEQVAVLSERGLLFVQGDATEDDALEAAGIERAAALATVLPSDADNLFVTVTCRALNRELTIVARASSEKNEPKMIAAGATRVLNPYRNGGRLIARQLLHPSVTEFIDLIQTEKSHDLSLEEVRLAEGSPLAGAALRRSPIRSELDVIVVGIRRGDGRLEFNPSGDVVPGAGDVLVVLGRPDNLSSLARLAGTPG